MDQRSSEVLRMLANDIEPVPDIIAESGGTDIDSKSIRGVGKLDDGNLIILLDIEKVLATSPGLCATDPAVGPWFF